MKFFNETLQNLPFFGIQISFCTTLFSQIILKKKIKKKGKTIWGFDFVIPNLWQILKCFARIFQKTKTANS